MTDETGDEPLVDALTRLGDERHGGTDRDMEGARALIFGTAPPPPETIGRFTVSGVLGRGGMAVVKKGIDPDLDREVAIKLMIGSRSTADHGRRLRQEARVLARLRHPNIVPLYEVGEHEGQLFLVMELVPGPTLETWQRTPRSWAQCLRVFIQAGTGLAAAHAEGIVHRDFKPSNCMIDGDEARVLDFGLARFVQLGGDGTPSPSSWSESGVHTVNETDPGALVATEEHDDDDDDDNRLTATGVRLGTPTYMAPEQWLGADATELSDQFSFCVSLFESVYGQLPFGNDPRKALSAMAMGDAIEPAVPAGSRVPRWLRQTIVRGLQAKPESRWPSMDALLVELRRPRGAWRQRTAMFGVGLLGIGGLSFALLDDAPKPCQGAAAEIEAAWGTERREQVHTAILATEVPYAQDTWNGVSTRLDAYTTRFIAAHTDACEATAVRHQQSEDDRSLRMDCLRRHELALSAVTEVLAHADASVVETAIEMADGLPSLDRCEDLPRLRLLQQQVPPPEDAPVALEVSALRERLAAADAEREAGRYADAINGADSVVARARALAYPPLHAEALRLRGVIRDAQGHFAEAEDDLQRAYTMAARVGHEQVELDAARALVVVVGNHRARPAEGLQWSTTALPLAERHDDVLAQSSIFDAQGAVHGVQGDFAAAENRHRASIELLESISDEPNPRLANTLNNLGGSIRAQGRAEEAERVHQRALDMLEQVLGPDHPDLVASMINLGTVHAKLGDTDEAEAFFRRGHALAERSLGPDHPKTAASADSLGTLLQRQGKYDEAETHYRRALEIRQRALGDEHPDIAKSLINLGTIMVRRGRPVDAEDYLRRALAVQEKVLGEDHPDLAHSYGNLGMVLYLQERDRESMRAHRRALEIREKALGPDHPDVAISAHNVGMGLLEMKEYAQAEQRFAQSLRITEKAVGAEHPNLAYPLMSLAKAALAQQQWAKAKEYAARAVKLREGAAVDPAMLAAARFALARALWAEPAQRERARAMVTEAHAVFLETGDGMAFEQGETKTWLETHRL